MAVVLNHTKNGLLPFPLRSIQSSVCLRTSASKVFMRSRVSGPVLSIFCLPTRPNFGSSVGSSTLVAQVEALQLCSHSVIGLPDDAPGLLGLRSIQVAAIRTGSHPACDRLVRALFALLPGCGRALSRARTLGRPCYCLEMGAALRPGNGTGFALEAQTHQRQLACG